MKLRGSIAVGSLLVGAVVVALTGSRVAGAAEYSADVVVRSYFPNGTLQSAGRSRIYVKGRKSRAEMISQKSCLSGHWQVQIAPPPGSAAATIKIDRFDRGVSWALDVARRTYVETHSATSLAQGADPVGDAARICAQIGPGACTCNRVATETRNGYVCDRYDLIHYRVPEGGLKGVLKKAESLRTTGHLPPALPGKVSLVEHRWVARKLGTYIRTDVIYGGKCLGRTELVNIKLGNVPDAVFELPKGYRKVAAPAPRR